MESPVFTGPLKDLGDCLEIQTVKSKQQISSQIKRFLVGNAAAMGLP